MIKTKSKILVIIACCLLTLSCFGQERNIITFVKIKDTAKRISDTLPLMADIKIDAKSGYYVLILSLNDSSITGLNSIFNSQDTSLQNRALDNYSTTLGKILKNKSLKHIEKEKQIRYLQALLFFKDTVRIKINTTSKITFKREPYRFHAAFKAICFLGGIACLFTTLGELSETRNSTSNSQSFIHGGASCNSTWRCCWISYIISSC